MSNTGTLANTVQVFFRVDEKAFNIEEIREFLIELDVWEKSVEEYAKGTATFSIYCDDQKNAEQVIHKLKHRFAHLIIRSRLQQPQDWIHAWKDSFRPFRLTAKIDVVPFDHMPLFRQKANRTAIFIDTSLAFGTGMHETTQFMAGFIESKGKQLGRFCDVGCGTGILSILALSSGAESVYAFDFDREAVRIAKANFALNQCRNFTCEFADINNLSDIGMFDFVAANLVTDDLIKARRQLLKLVMPGKYIAVSGISLDNCERFRKAIRSLPLRCLRILRGKKWTALLFKRI